MFLDFLILAVLALAIFIGFKRGLIEPLLTELGFFGTLLLFFVVRHPYGALLENLLPGPVLPITLAVAVALVAGFAGSKLGQSLRKKRALRGIDGLVGVAIHAVVATVVLYLLVSVLVVVNQAFNKIENLDNLTLAQVDQVTTTINSNPLA